MGMFDNDQRHQSELMRVVARILKGDQSLTVEQYMLGMPSLLLMHGQNPKITDWDLMRGAFSLFESVCPSVVREQIYANLASFSGHMGGQSLFVWEPVFLCDSDFRLRAAAVHAAATLSVNTPEDKLMGVKSMLDYIVQQGEVSLLEGLFLMCDMRVLPLIEETWKRMSTKQKDLSHYIHGCCSLPLMLFFEHILRDPSVDLLWREKAVDLLSRMPEDARLHPPICLYHPFPEGHPDYEFPQIIDAITPVPAWRFSTTLPTVLHTWTCAEYLLRFLPKITPQLSAEQILRLKSLWRPQD